MKEMGEMGTLHIFPWSLPPLRHVVVGEACPQVRMGGTISPPPKTHVRPVLKIEGQPVGQVGDPSGSLRSVGLQDLLWVDLFPPGESGLPFEHTEFTFFAGQSFSTFVNWSRVGKERVEDRKKSPPSPTSAATESYYTTALEYFHRQDKDGDALGNVMRVTNLKQGAVGIFGLNMAVASIGGFIILSAVPAGIMIDIRHDLYNPFPQEESATDAAFFERRKEYAFLYGLNSSFWEYRILEVLDNVDSISATKALQAAKERALDLLSLLTGAGTAEVQAFLDRLPFQIRRGVDNAISAGFEVITASSTITIEDWTGIAYITRHPKTGVGAFVISGTMGESFTLSGGGNWTVGLTTRMRILFPQNAQGVPVGPLTVVGQLQQASNFLGGLFRQDISDTIFWQVWPNLPAGDPRWQDPQFSTQTDVGRNPTFNLILPTTYFIRANGGEFSGERAPIRFVLAAASTFTLRAEDLVAQADEDLGITFISRIDTATLTVERIVQTAAGETRKEIPISVTVVPTTDGTVKLDVFLKISDIDPALNRLFFNIKDRFGNPASEKELDWKPGELLSP